MITIYARDSRTIWDQENETFVDGISGTLTLEHNLLSISKWEAKWRQAFLGPKPKTPEMELDYIRCMDQDPSSHHPLLYRALTPIEIQAIKEYIESPHSATGFHKRLHEENQRRGKDIVTSELIYYWITSFGVDWRVETWHLNRLLRLIKIFEAKQPKTPKAPNFNAHHYKGRRGF